MGGVQWFPIAPALFPSFTVDVSENYVDLFVHLLLFSISSTVCFNMLLPRVLCGEPEVAGGAAARVRGLAGRGAVGHRTQRDN